MRCWLILVCLPLLVYSHSSVNDILFVENRGQITNGHGFPNPEVLYVYETPGFRLQLRRNGWSYEFVQILNDERHLEAITASSKDAFFQVSRIDVTIAGAAEHPIVYATNPAPFPLHYFGSMGQAITDVKHVQNVVYKDILPAVDLEFTILRAQPNPQIKYSFRLHAGANPEGLKLIYGSSSGKLEIAGALSIQTPLGVVRESQPLCYAEDHSSFFADFVASGNVVQFAIPQNFIGKPLLIDPILTYATYFGGDSIDYSEDMKLDHEGNIIVAGRTASMSNIATSGAYDQSYNGGSFDIFLFKFNEQFQMQWATYFGGNRVDYCWALDIDNKGRIYVGGETYSSGLTTAGAQQSVINGPESDGLLARFGSNGHLQWCRYYGGANKDQILSIALDGLGRIIATGYTLSNDSIATAGAHMPFYGGKGDIFLAAFDTTKGDIIWGTYYGADKDDRGHHVAISASNQIYVSGTALSKTGIATPGANQSQGANLLDAFLARFTPDGFPVWGTYIAGAFEDRGRDCIVDLEGNIVVTGFTQSDTGFTTPGAWQPNHVFGIDSTGYYTLDAFLQKYDSNGVLLWGTYFGDTLSETVRGLTVNNANEILICGATFSPKGIAIGNAWQLELGGVSDAWFAKFTPDGQLLYSTYFGGDGDEQVGGYGLNIETDNQNRIYVCSSTTSDDSIATLGAYQIYRAGNYDIFLARFDDKCFDRYEPNNSFNTPADLKISYDTTQPPLYGAIASASDEDFFAFELAQPQQQLLVTLKSLAADYNLFIYDSYGTLITQSVNAGLQPENVSTGLINAGTYVLAVRSADPTQWNDSLCYELFVHLDSNLYTAQSAINTQPYFHTYPNPFACFIQIEFQLPTASLVSVMLENINGHRFYARSSPLAAGQHRWLIETQQLPAGCYTLTVLTQDTRFMKKLIRVPAEAINY
ncbi:MAG: SBBP repeat-containing protein [Chitinophagales bacterium]|nr:SBBP repeat-containing protein [Chitinophagales bacterium]MDW8427160.1 SBBP repeat-containing protein [Chitinophagales bacterium]